MTTPTHIHLHKHAQELELEYAAGESYRLKSEYLRVYSPSAEVRGHGKDQEVLQSGKKYVNIQALHPVGNYAIQLVFTDGHDTGIYSWDYLYELCVHQEQKWSAYLRRLAAARASREPVSEPIIFKG